MKIKRLMIIVYLVEASGGIAPQPLARLRRNARFAKTKGARDSTKYGTTRVSPRSYFTHAPHAADLRRGHAGRRQERARANRVPQAERVRGRLSGPHPRHMAASAVPRPPST